MRLRDAIAAAMLAGAAGPSAADGLAGRGPVGSLPPGLAAMGADVAGAALAALIREGMAEAEWFGLRPLEPSMRVGMAGFFPAEALDRVRWGIAPEGSRLRGALFGPGPVDAVTLGDVILFRDDAAAADAKLMAHELAHVLQYERWGVDGFARRYVTGAAAMEVEARRVADAWADPLRVSPRPVPRPEW